MVFHALGSLVVFLLWRIAGMPAPGTLGRLIPLAWLITAILSVKEGIPRWSPAILFLFALLAVFWAAAPPMFLLASSCALAGLFPGLLRISERRLGIVMAVLPLVPLILALVPFTGDEPHYAEITESLFPGGGERFTAFAGQAGDPGSGFRHHQSLFPALMTPGYPLGISGMRTVSLIFAIAAGAVISRLLMVSGISMYRRLAAIGLLTLPGSSVLGLLYPGWLAVAVFSFAAWTAVRGGRKVWVLAAAFALVLIKIRFIGISVGLLLALIMDMRGRRRFTIPLLLAALAAAGLLFDRVFLNGGVFWVRYGNWEFVRTVLVQPIYRYSELMVAFLSTLLDAESGLLWKAPWVLAAIAGMPLLRRDNRRVFRWLGLPSLFYLLFLVYWAGHNWSGMPTPAGRMLLPLLPLLLASLGKVMERRGTRMLVWISIALSAVYLCHPLLRFNYADGTDALFSAITGPGSALSSWIPSAVRVSVPVFAGWTAAAAAVTWMIYRGKRASEYFITALIGILCLMGGSSRSTWEAEDIPSRMRSFCSIYPSDAEPESRKYWFFSRERMLRLSGPGDAVFLPVARQGDDTLTVDIRFRSLAEGDNAPGISVSCGTWADSLYAVSEVMDPPGWVGIIRDTRLETRPENLREMRWTLEVPAECSTLVVRGLPADPPGTGGMQGIYLDEISTR